MLVIKKRSKLIKSLSAGVVMFAVGLTGSVAYLDAMTPSSDFVYNTGKDTLTRTGSSAEEATTGGDKTSDQSTGATSSSSDQAGHAAPLASAPSGAGTTVTSDTNVPVVDQTIPAVEAPQAEETSLVDGILNMLP